MFKDHVNLLYAKVKSPIDQFGEVALHLSDSCQLNCVFCSLPRQKYNISIKTISNVMQGFPINKVIVGFGEPMCASKEVLTQLPSLIGTRRNKLITNGVQYLGDLVKDECVFEHVRVSLDAASTATYKDIKGVDHFEEVLSNIEKYLASSATRVGVDFVINSRNIEEITSIVELCFDGYYRKYPLKFYLQFKLLYSNGYSDFLPSEAQALHAYEKISHLLQKNNWLRFFLEKNTNYNIVQFASRVQTIPPTVRSCLASQITNVITTTGDVYPCSDYAHRRICSLGNINIDSLSRIFQRQYEFLNEICPETSAHCLTCSKRELNVLLNKFIEKPINMASSVISQLAINDSIFYFYTNDHIELLNY